MEIARTSVIGNLPAEKRLFLDAVAVVIFIVFAIGMFRFVGATQQRLERQNQELLALHTAGLNVASDLSLDVVLKKVVDLARSLVGAKYGALSVIDDRGNIEAFITSGISDEERAAIGPPPVGHGVLGVVLHEGVRLRLPDIAQHPKSAGFPPNHPHMKSLLAVPVPSQLPFRGNLYLADKHSRSGVFSADDERTLERFAVQAAIAIDNAQLHAKAADLAIAQERVRIAHEMHDGLAQVLGYVNTKVQAATAYLNRGKIEEATQQMKELAVSAREAYTDVRESIVGLRSLPDEGRSMSDALVEFVERWKEQSGVVARINVDASLRLRTAVELQLIRIVQESLTNVRKHAKASRVWIDIKRDGETLRACVKDDGQGFLRTAPARGEFPRFGLTTMYERAASIGGALMIDSAPRQGTTVNFEMPLARALGE
ncbi:MAG TPA: GAF domain-containing sensor histidine kinase [Thermoanaerobaculia bacterium]|nr:GAF domain-containing sensor histidine kinase [Thermoanaerobaculia bacterium]